MPLETLTDRAKRRRFLKPFAGEAVSPPPIWLMRQAGRYLPEYREIRSQAGSFLNLCYSPELAAEVTLQPIRRYKFDASILFSDILVVPHALGQEVRFVEGEGPRLDPIDDAAALAGLRPEKAGEKYSIVAQTVSILRRELPDETALIGFCGAPWTVATYMVGGRGSPDQAAARLLAYKEPDTFQRLIDVVVESSVEYLSLQVEAGADALQIFDSWAGSLADNQFGRWVVEPTRVMVARMKEKYPEIPILGFPRGADQLSASFAKQTGVDGVSCNTAMPINGMVQLSDDTGCVVQGNLDPLLVVAGGQQLDDRVEEILSAMKGRKFIFNLGHGILQYTPPENVARLVDAVRASP